MKPVNLQHLDTLLALVDAGSFEAAARDLGITTSAVIQRVKTMEKSAGRVLVRRTSAVGVTEAGAVLVQAARRMALVQAEANAQLKGRLERIPLAIAVNADSLATWFRRVFASAATWPDVALRMQLEDEARTQALLRRGDVLGAVTREARPISGCEVTALGRLDYFPVASPSLRARYTNHEGIDWAHLPVLRFGPNDVLQDTDLEGRLPAHVRRRRRASHIPSSEAFVEAARAGLGWALLPGPQARPLLESGELVQLDAGVIAVDLY